MPLLGFTKLKAKLLDGSKTQTIRKPRKHPLKVGDTLYIYWNLRMKSCEKLGEAIVTKIVRKKAFEFTREDAIKDGFEADQFRPALNNLVLALEAMHPTYYTDDKEFDIITFEWTRKESMVKWRGLFKVKIIRVFGTDKQNCLVEALEPFSDIKKGEQWVTRRENLED